MNDLTDQPPGATPLDDISGLRQPHITTLDQLNAAEQLNIQQATDWLAKARNLKSMFTVPWLTSLHHRMYKDVWSWAGEYRRTVTNIGVPPHEVPMRLAILAADFNTWFHSKSAVFNAIQFAASFHHRLVWVHPFPNGNGRWSRLAVDAVFLRLLKRAPLAWGEGDLVSAGEERARYIDALRAADRGNIQPLVDYLIVLNGHE